MPERYFFPISRANEITLLYYRTLMEMRNPYARKMLRQNGSHSYFTYHKVDTP